MQAAKDLGQNAISITDHGTLSSHRDMQRAAKDLGMKPILGVEAYISETDRFDRRAVKKREDNTQAYNHIILLAKNQDGVKSLQKLSEVAWTEGFYGKPRIDLEILEENRDGLIVLSGCMNGLISKAIERGNETRAQALTKWFVDTFGSDFYMEIQPHNPADLNHTLLDLSNIYGVQPVVTSDCHFATESQRAIEEALLIISTKPSYNPEADFAKSRKMEIFERLNYLYPDRPISFQEIDTFVTSRGQIAAKLEAQGIKRTDIYENTLAIVDKVGDYDYVQGKDLLPVPKRNADARLREKCEEGLREMGLAAPEYTERLDYELAIIKKKKFAAYFLILDEIVSWSKEQGIMVGPGRGSAAGSLVCYSRGITSVDPIKYGLLFERFINEERNDFPDIDTDFQDTRRGEVKEFIGRKFKHVASIATYNYFKDKNVIKDAARVFKIPLHEVEAALKTVNTFEEFEVATTTKEFRMKYPEVLSLAKELRGRIRGTGMHAAGIVTSKEAITNFAPMESRPDPQDKGGPRIPVIAYDMEEAADIGLIKLDALGLKTLSVIQDTLKMIDDHYKIVIDPVKDIPLDDEEIFYDLSNGYTKGVFQAEATPYTNLLMKMGVETFEDLVISNALVRPGAMNTVGALYLDRKNGDAVTEYVHPIMQPYLENTRGVVIYQEQVMQACVYLAGMSWAEADKIRKIIGKKKDVHEFDAYRDKFIKGASEHISEKKAAALWHDFEAHAGYSFNRSHAVAYSMISYWTAWLKHYYPLEFIFAILKNEKDKDKRTEYLLEAKRLSVKVLLPHINESDLDFSIEGKSIRFGLANIKFCSDKIGSNVIRHRPYKSYADFLEKAGETGSGINSRAIAAFNAIGAAAFDDNPRTGNESDNFYEYLSIPKFDTKGITPEIRAQISPLSDFEETGCFIFMAMVKEIKRGKGWSRVELVDDTGSVGIFHTEGTQIEKNNMYVFLVGENRIHRYVTLQDVADRKDDVFIKYLYSTDLKIEPHERRVIDFSARRTKSNTMMAHLIIADNNKQLQRVIVFPKGYTKALGKMRPGAACTPVIEKLDDGAEFVKDIL